MKIKETKLNQCDCVVKLCRNVQWQINSLYQPWGGHLDWAQPWAAGWRWGLWKCLRMASRRPDCKREKSVHSCSSWDLAFTNHDPNTRRSAICYNLWWEFQSIMADASWRVDIWMVDGSQESYVWRLKRVSVRGNRACTSDHRTVSASSHKRKLNPWGNLPLWDLNFQSEDSTLIWRFGSTDDLCEARKRKWSYQVG